MSSDGRYTAFESSADDLVDGDTNGVSDVFVHDAQTGVTTRVSVSTGGGQATGGSGRSTISADGRYVAFSSYATDLVAGDTNNGTDIFLHDTHEGTTRRVSVATGGGQCTGSSYNPAISADGRYVGFNSDADGLVPGDLDGLPDVFIHDTQTGGTERVSVWTGGSGMAGYSYSPAISADGRYVAFMSSATGTVAKYDVYLHDRQAGTTVCVSVPVGGGTQGNSNSKAPAISADGRYVAFHSYSSDLIEGDTNGRVDVFVRDMHTGTTERVSVATGGGQANTGSAGAAISADGRYVAFAAHDGGLIADDTNGSFDVFVHDRGTCTTVRVSTDAGGGQSSGSSYDAAISADGRYVAFGSDATDLVPGDTNGCFDIFLRNRLPLVVRIEGSTRYETAVQASRTAFPDGASSVVISTGTNWPDALGGAALAGAVDGPILLVTKDSIPGVVQAEISRLGATQAYVLGGTGAIGEAVEDSLIARLGAGNVVRLGGASRFQTANLIAEETIGILGGAYDGTAFVATGGNFPDALAGSPLAASQGWPIFLATSDSAPTSAMQAAGVTDILILGGPGAVSARIEDQLENVFGDGNVDRLAGDDRYSTGVAIATYGVDTIGLSWDDLAITTGSNFPDALAGGVLPAGNGSVLLLTAPTALPGSVAAALSSNKGTIAGVYYLGGLGAVSQGVRDAVAAQLQ